jgi:two-component system response regulator RegA
VSTYFAAGKLGASDAELMRGLASGGGPGLSGPRRRILLVDDSAPFLRNMSSLLQGHGYETETAESIEEGLDKLEVFQPHLVTIDNLIQGQSGLAALIKVKQRQPQVRVVIIAEALDQESATSAILNGASECIVKPVDTQRLLSVVRSLTG